MTRIAIVATSEKLRASLAAALRSNPEFELVGVGATSAEVPPSDDVELIARTLSPSRVSGRSTESATQTVLSNREREILALLVDARVNKQIAARLGISTNTDKSHPELLVCKVGVSTLL